MTTTLTDVKPQTREATLADLPRLVEMFRTFTTSEPYRTVISDDAEMAEAYIRDLLDNPAVQVFVTAKGERVIGMLGVCSGINPMSGDHVATELFWWFDPDQRGAGCWLLRRAERWAKARGATRMQMMAPHGRPRIEAMYAVAGYRPIERVFQRDL